MKNTLNEKGYVQALLITVLATVLALTVITVISTERARNKIKTQRIQHMLFAENAAEIARHLLIKELPGKEFWIEENSSTTIYAAGYDFSEVCEQVEAICMQESPELQEISCSIRLPERTVDEMTIQNLDIDGALIDMNEYITGRLAPLEYAINIRLGNIALEEIFLITDINFILLERDENDMLIALETNQAVIDITEREYSRARGSG